MILVTGATGLTGSRIVRALSAQGVPVKALVRNLAKASHLLPLPGVVIAQGDMARPDSLRTVLEGVERAMLISSSAPDMLEVQTNFLHAAKKAGVSRVVKLSGIMAERDSPFRFARMHGEAEQELEDSGMAFTHLRAGEFMHAYFRQVPSLVNHKVLFLPMNDARIASVDIDDLALAAAQILKSPGHENKTYFLTGPLALTMNQVAHELSKAVGFPVTYVNADPEEVKRRQLASGMTPYMADALAELFAERKKGKEAAVHQDLAVLLGRQAAGFGEFVQRHAAVFRGEQPAP